MRPLAATGSHCTGFRSWNQTSEAEARVRSRFGVTCNPPPRPRKEGKAAGGEVDVNTALPEVLKTALIHDGLARGIREAAKALDKRHALLCVLASDCDEPMYVKRVEALCAEQQINLVKVDDNKGTVECRLKGESFWTTVMMAVS
nr:40S ribosomal protein S12-like [Rattus norvegicus]